MDTDNTKLSAEDAEQDLELDAYGRTEAERTITLTPKTAEAVSNEVDLGKHDSYDDALEYVISRGFAEIKRQRESLQKTADARKAAKSQAQFNQMLRLDPTIAADPVRMLKLLTECQMIKS